LHKIENKVYKSPLHKLVRFFEQSRDGWKEKHGKAKTQNKYLQNRICSLERSRNQWKQEALELRRKNYQIESGEKKEKIVEEGRKRVVRKL
jgi:nitrate/TMAO reductase-like tetraheme cytochrome c subunit